MCSLEAGALTSSVHLHPRDAWSLHAAAGDDKGLHLPLHMQLLHVEVHLVLPLVVVHVVVEIVVVHMVVELVVLILVQYVVALVVVHMGVQMVPMMKHMEQHVVISLQHTGGIFVQNQRA